MADACFTARATTRDHVREAIEKLALPKNSNGQFNHDAATNFKAAVARVLRSTFNPINPGCGMSGLCTKSSDVAKITTTSVATIQSVLDEAAAKARAASTLTHTATPTISTRSDAQEEADRINLLNQAVIGAKEGAAEAITNKVGSDITDTVLKTADGSDFKGVDDYQLEDLLTAVLQGADRPSTTDILEQFMGIIAFTFNFQKKVGANMELLRAKVGSMQSYGINVDETQLALILLANIENAASEDYGREFRPALQSIRRQYPYNYVHDATSLGDMLTELAGADAVRKLKDAPLPTQGAANAVTKQLQTLSRLFQAPDNSDYDSESQVTEYASAVDTSDSDSSVGTRRSKSRKGRKTKDRRGGDRHSKRSESRGRSKNKCPHCKLFKRKKAHPNTPEDRCFWNKAWKGFRPDWVCREMELKYKPRHKFSADMGGYPSESEDEE